LRLLNRLSRGEVSSSAKAELPRRLASRLAISLSRANSASKASSSGSLMPARLVELCLDTSQAWPLYSLASDDIMAPARKSQSLSRRSVELRPSSFFRLGVMTPATEFLTLALARCEEDLLLPMCAPGAEGVRWCRRGWGPGERERSRGVVGADLPWR
jgi:hypothetical protein